MNVTYTDTALKCERGHCVHDLNIESKGTFLSGKHIALCVSGGIAATEAPKLIRELRRYGARVSCFVTENALKFIGKASLEWASAEMVVTEPSGLSPHVCEHDACVVFPGTTNIIGHMAHGLCDSVVDTLLQSALGRKVPILIWPTMHDSLFESPAFQDNIKYLKGIETVEFFEPRVEEGKKKAPDSKHIAVEICHALNKRNLRVAVTLGGTCVPIDAVRHVGNASSGKLGQMIATEFYASGIQVLSLEASTHQPMPVYKNMRTVSVRTYEAMRNALAVIVPQGASGHAKQIANSESWSQGIAGLVMAAAISDFACDENGGAKIKSNSTLQLLLTPTDKLIALPNLAGIPFKIGFKLTQEAEVSGVKIARSMIAKYGLNGAVWNHIGNFESDGFAATYVDNESGAEVQLRGREAVARCLVQTFIGKLK